MEKFFCFDKERLNHKRVVVRCDLNVPIDNLGNIGDDTRILSSLPTLRHAVERGALVTVLSHLGRPQVGEKDPRYSLAPVARRLSEAMDMPVPLLEHGAGASYDFGRSPLALLENTRFLPGEKTNSRILGQQLATLGSIFVMDAFGCAHRKHASTHAIAEFAQEKAAGILLDAEIDNLQKMMKSPQRPMVAVIGGAKIAEKLPCIGLLAKHADTLILGGGIANTYLLSRGYSIGSSLAEPTMAETMQGLDSSPESRGKIVCPLDVVCADSLENPQQIATAPVSDIPPGMMIADIGSQTSELYSKIIRTARTILWSGPLGVFEQPDFAQGTRQLGRTIASSTAFSSAGGGDTSAAIKRFDLHDHISFVSTGGSAFLEYMGSGTLPGIVVLE